MSNFQEIRPSYSMQHLPSYAQPTQLHPSPLQVGPNSHQLPPSPRQPQYSPFQGNQEPLRFGFSFRGSAESKGNAEGSGSQGPLTFNTSSPHKARLKKSFRPSSRGGEGQGRKNETSSRSKLEDFSRTTSTFVLLSTPPQPQQQQGVAEKTFLQFQKGNFQSSSNKSTSQAKQNGWGSRSDLLAKEVDSLKHTVDAFQREILRLSEDSNNFKQQAERQAQQISSLAHHNEYLQKQCKHYLLNCEDKNAQLLASERMAQALEERNKALQEELQNSKSAGQSKREEKELLAQAQSALRQQEAQLARKDSLIEEMKKASEEMKKVIDEKEKAIEEKEKQCAKLVKEKEEELGRLSRVVDAQSSKLMEQEHSLQVDHSQIDLLQIKMAHLLQSNQQLYLSSQGLQTQLTTFKQDMSQQELLHQQKVAQLNAEIGQLQGSLRAACEEKGKIQLQWESSVSSLQAEVAVSSAARVRLQQEKEDILAQLDRKDQQLRKEQQESDKLKRWMGEVEQEVRRVGEREREGREKLGVLQRELEGTKNRLQQAEQAWALAVQQKEELTVQLATASAHLQQCEDIILQIERHHAEEKSLFQTHLSQLQQRTLRETAALEQQHQAKVLELMTLLEAHQQQHRSEIEKIQTQIQYLHHQQAEERQQHQLILNHLSQTIAHLQLTRPTSSVAVATQQFDIVPQATVPSETDDLTASEVEPWCEQSLSDNFIWVDQQGVQYLWELLGCSCREEGILNSIIKRTQSLVEDLGRMRHPVEQYRELLGLFQIEEDDDSNYLLVQSITELREHAAILLKRTKELEYQQEAYDDEVSRLKRTRRELSEREKESRTLLKHTEELNSHLNEEVVRLMTTISSSRMSTRTALHLIEGL